MAGLQPAPRVRCAVTRAARVINGKVFSDFPAAERISLREWLALITLITGLLIWAGLIVGGAAWLIYEVLRRWR